MLTKTLFLPDETATLIFAAELASKVDDGVVLFLNGQLGAGKTTFSRGFLRGLGYAGPVKSPTYTLVEPYDLNGRALYHFDFYRVKDPHELEFMGVRDYFIPHAICLVEWPECGGDLLPSPDLSCYIDLQEQGRKIKIEANSQLGEEIIKRLI